MLGTQIKRMCKTSWLSLIRNGWLATATVLVMTLVLSMIGGLLLLSVVANTILADLKGKIDISVYFFPATEEQGIMAVKKSIEGLREVREVGYVSQVQALDEFRERHKDDAVILSSIDELDANPLEATLNIRANTPEDLAFIAGYLKDKNYPIVDKINYFENQRVIDRLSSVLASIKSVGLVMVLALAFVAILVAFNAIRLAIFTAREEIGIMRLVGASSWYIRGPFLLSGMLHGMFAAVLTSLMFYGVIWIVSPKVAFLLPQMDLFGYFQSSFIQFLGVLLAAGVLLGGTSSFIAIRRYLKV
ncbi:MAG: hypothetical protein A3I44_00280 [Candidatus Sungbacteria bacterium RIFCSPLOWO2_02_FULL_51_17]|uniref:Cell division protein FtsX n=1 Tax=Candidatus Sungbacteria bacterium RIFCSPHIGHO2_02_FULL_51_29 TaxID=1802273 RepID=A0A1G2KS53_9BACT|nr:MAG: hypothetical protein A2676_04665 [Candidatus Sungbacteria bacterium RIFCSPHIGHO2_01_FULL_51_22]OHA01301.1 MAG: hypothetical protein A3C16_02035 [Candidatus Sungbacteria bacterium RIFCSPHIGHO2_02_FULL_51_29]OHA06470.1 MAG: hypothetical protein A3B29_05420 [Candidatus Sungbacteria bacterium RIFCSPLOWO2_01_FULL_51_34]OHA12532.1 MAG: hypothetical protein A3I44_00280 [Candidatus Sungbacteria bacterium RIFCSPLOWO2_02_FULL_51_17]